MAASADTQVALIYTLGTLGMLMMAGAIILFVLFYQKRMIQEQLKRQTLEVEHQKIMLQATLESQENERKRVSKDLHDDVGMMLMTMRTQINSMAGKNLSGELIDQVRHVVDETHETVRRISWNLMPPTLERFGLGQTLREMCERASDVGTTRLEFLEQGKSINLEKQLAVQLYRIVQEGVTNALRHAKASEIKVKLGWQATGVIIGVEDNGIGFEIQKESTALKERQGLGLLNLQSRASLLGAQLVFERNDPSGTIMNLTLLHA